MSIDGSLENSDDTHYLDTVEGEIALFRSVTLARPVGIHRHFHVLSIRNAIFRDTGHHIPIPDIWDKLRSCYDLDILENIEVDNYDITGPRSPPVLPVRTPSPSDNLSIHPFFRREFTLPSEESVDSLIAVRRVRASVSLPSSSPAASPSVHGKSSSGTRETKRSKSNLKNMAGLVGGDSDSSALTQESGDESTMPTPRESVATGTDAGTEYAEDEDVETRDASPASKQPRKTSKASRRGTGGSRGRGGSTAGGRGTKKKKK
ncbi:chromatin modification-related protein EAF7-domain-containing protein [Amylocystis lapponica]|nr:chromatin modification-related protein EAF7-domain-containing protein [Amylocystis lapponica]